MIDLRIMFLRQKSKQIRRILLYICVVSLLILLYIVRTRSSLNCFDTQDEPTLRSIFDVEVPLGSSIFFLDTTCNSDFVGKIVINRRVACSVEAAAKLHPNRSVYLLYSSPGVIQDDNTPSDRYIRALLTYENVNILHMDVEKFVEGTPVQELYHKKSIELSPFKINHYSDMLRLVTLWRYGGVYLDNDAVVLKSFDNLTENFVGIENEQLIANGVLGFSEKGVGHHHLSEILQDFNKNYTSVAWTGNGPELVTKLAKKLCNTDDVRNMTYKECLTVKIYPERYFYPVWWQNWQMYFEESFKREVEELTKNSYAVHIWNKLTSQAVLKLDSTAAYMTIARKSCPKIVNELTDVF